MHTGRIDRAALITLALVGAHRLEGNARAEESACTTTVTTTVHCTGSAAPLAVPATVEQQPPPPPPVYTPPVYTPPAYAPWPPMPFTPPTTHVEERRNTGLMTAGLGVLGGLWLNSTLAGVAAGDALPAIPLFGPWATLAHNLSTPGSCGLVNTALVFDGLGQAAGLTMVIVGLATTTRVRVYDTPGVTLAPAVVPSGGGLAAIGRF